MHLRPVLPAAVVLCILLLIAAPAAAADFEVGSAEELTAAINAAPTDGTPTNIYVTQSFDVGSVNLFSIDDGKNITLMPGSTPGISINRSVASSIFYNGMFTVREGAQLTLSANETNPASTLTIDGGNFSSNKQCLVVVGGGFTMSDGVLTGNAVTDGPGGVSVHGTFTMSGGVISGNTGGSGPSQIIDAGIGGVRVKGGTFTMSGGKISNNIARSNGGGVLVDNGTFTMSGGEISGNTAIMDGGGVYVSDCTFTMTGGKISGNTATEDGGGVYTGPFGGTFTMSGGEISGNTAIRDGGGVFARGSFTMTGNAVIDADNELYFMSQSYYLGLSGSSFTGSAKNISGSYYDVIILGNQLIQMTGSLQASEVQDKFTLRDTRYILVPDADNRNLLVSQPSQVYSVTVTDGTGTGSSYVKGQPVTIRATVPSGKTFDHWETTGITLDIPTAADTTFVMPAGDVTATAVFKGSSVPPRITVISPPSGTAGTSYSTILSAEGTAPITWSIDSGSLPAGLTLDPATGKITGTPTTAGTFPFTVKATNSEGSATAPVTIIISSEPVAPTISVTPPPAGTAGSPYSTTLSAEGTAPITWSIDSGSLPPGLTLDPDTGKISGTPTTAGTFPFTIKASNSEGSDTAPVTITIAAGPSPSPSPSPSPAPSFPDNSSSGGNTDNSYRVLFDTQGGSFISPATGLSAGDRVARPAAPVKDGCTFGGWYADSACTREWNFADAIPGDLTLYAKWTAAAPTPTATGTAAAAATATAPATATATAAGTADATATVTVTAPEQQQQNPHSDQPGSQPGGQPSIAGFLSGWSASASQAAVAGIAGAAALLLLLWYFVLSRKSVTFLIRTADGFQPYKIRVRKNHPIREDQLPDDLRRQIWYFDPNGRELWNFEEDTVVENITLWSGGTR